MQLDDPYISSTMGYKHKLHISTTVIMITLKQQYLTTTRIGLTVLFEIDAK